METTAKINSMIQEIRGILSIINSDLNLGNLSTSEGWVLTIEGEVYGSPKPLAEYEDFLGWFVNWIITGTTQDSVVNL